MNDPQRKTGSSTFPTAQKKKGPPVVFIAGFIIVVVVLFLVGVLPRIQENKELHQMHDETVGAVPVVHTIMAKPASKTESLTLP
jgi:uncharacterized membrane protein